jgi:hypothetical protein
MVAVIGRACHATALVVHLFSCVVVGTDDKADVLACECYCVSHIEHKLLSLGCAPLVDFPHWSLQGVLASEVGQHPAVGKCLLLSLMV